MTSNLCSTCMEVLDEDGTCSEPACKEILKNEEQGRLRTALLEGIIRPKLRLGNLFGQEGNALAVHGHVIQALGQLGFSRQKSDLFFDGWMKRTYVENLREYDKVFELVIDGPGDTNWTLDEFLVEYQGRMTA